MGPVSQFLIAFLCVLVASVLNAGSKTQTLLDQLGRAQSMEQATPIVKELWKEWTAAHNNEDEKALMVQGIAAMS